jgi:hypothetical protein
MKKRTRHGRFIGSGNDPVKGKVLKSFGAREAAKIAKGESWKRRI